MFCEPLISSSRAESVTRLERMHNLPSEILTHNLRAFQFCPSGQRRVDHFKGTVSYVSADIEKEARGDPDHWR
jgi:hypothetical protein